MNLRRNHLHSILAWCLYDWGISAFPVIVITFVFATYFTNQVALNKIVGTQQWGNAMALAGIITAILSPILGAIADSSGKRNYWLGLFTLLVVISAAIMWFVYPNASSTTLMLFCVVLGTIGLNISSVFYNSMLPHLTSSDYIGRVSGWGWGAGYFGGLTVLFIALYGFVNTTPTWLNTATSAQVRICGPLVAAWIVLFTFPLFMLVPAQVSSHVSIRRAAQLGLEHFRLGIKTVLRHKSIGTFLLAQMIYIDGLNTLFVFAGIYAAGTFHMSMTEILLFGIVINACAGIGSIILAWFDDWIGAKFTILLSLLCLFIFGVGTVIVIEKHSFWILSCCLSLFVGSVQSSSRSLMAQLSPPEQTTSMFGFYVLSGKMSTFIGPWLLGFMTAEFSSQRAGMAIVLCFFIVGAIVLLKVPSKPPLTC